VLQKPEGDRAKTPRVKAVFVYRDPPATPDRVASGFPAARIEAVARIYATCPCSWNKSSLKRKSHEALVANALKGLPRAGF
jgi:hypothetical protein